MYILLIIKTETDDYSSFSEIYKFKAREDAEIKVRNMLKSLLVKDLEGSKEDLDDIRKEQNPLVTLFNDPFYVQLLKTITALEEEIRSVETMPLEAVMEEIKDYLYNEIEFIEIREI